MTWHVWLAFAAAAALIGLVPGPGVMSIVGYALGSGRQVALASVAGIALGNALAMTLSLAGVGALLAASALAFNVVKWAGAAYLVGLGIVTLLRSRDDGAGGETTPVMTPRTAFVSNVAVGTFHPKTIVFFVAFAPQFISPDAAYAPQAALLIATFVGVVATSDTVYALLAARAAHLLRRPRARAWSKRISGGVLIASGVATATTR